ncbi:MAG: apolipoprotein N-acyltransferase [Candidatus Omnitrophica bacterium]|nr:apolipoprotein N-acyltransferase [Candidatus Omnitrophota bacterium]
MIAPIRNHSWLSSFLLCLISIVLTAVSFPKINLSPLIWFALVPWLLAMDGKSARQAFVWSYLVGFGFFGVTLYWIKFVTLGGTIALVAYLSLYFGFFGYFYAQFSNQNIGRKIIFYSSTWVVLEFIRGHLLSGFGWAALGHCQYENLALIQIVDTTGVYGISFLIVAVNVLIKENLCWVFSKENVVSKETLISANAAVLVVLLALYGYGLWQLRQPQPAKHVRIGVVQGNIPQNEKWLEENRQATIEKYLKLSKAALSENPEIIVWPETAFPGLIQEMPQLMEDVREFSRRENIPLLLGVVSQQKDDYYNSALLIMPDGDMNQRYDKLRLVPFGEFLPLRKQFPFLADFIPIEDFSFGKVPKVFWLSPQGENLFFSVPICFEDTISEVVRSFVQRGAQLVINITNDAWFQDTKEPFMHLQNAVFRSIETRRAMVRCANTGISCLIDPYGRIMRYVQNAHGKKTYVDGAAVFSVPIENASTFYTKSGDVFTSLCFVCILWQVFAVKRSERRRQENT